MHLIKAKKIYIQNELVENGTILVENGIIKAINPVKESYKDTNLIDLSELTVFPGFIDIHVHGGNGSDTMDMTYDAMKNISHYKLKEGVTGFCPSTVTASLEETLKVIKTVSNAIKTGVNGAKIIGSFLEGPYIDEKYRGAHKQEWIRKIDMNEIKLLIEAGEGSIKSFAVAPNKENMESAINYLLEKGINVRLGHTGATYNTAITAIDLGANIAIHTFNAMSQFNHRETGMAGAVLNDNRIYAELICDFIHICPEAVEILYKCKGTEKIILITDCMRAGGLPDGIYDLGGERVNVKNKTARTDEGVLAGSTLTMLEAVKNMYSLGIPITDVIQMATENPAKAIGIFDKVGSIQEGKCADLIALNDDFELLFIMVDGKIQLNNI